MTATYTFDVFSSSTASAHTASPATGAATRVSRSRVARPPPCLARRGERMVLGANTFRLFVEMLSSSTEESEVRDPWVSRMRSLPTTVVSTTLEGPLDWPDATLVERRRRRSRRPAQGGVRGAVALPRQPVDEPGADGSRSGDPRPGDAFPCDHRSDRGGPDLPRCGRLRPRADRAPDARRPHPRTHLLAHPARPSPSMRRTPRPHDDLLSRETYSRSRLHGPQGVMLTIRREQHAERGDVMRRDALVRAEKRRRHRWSSWPSQSLIVTGRCRDAATSWQRRAASRGTWKLPSGSRRPRSQPCGRSAGNHDRSGTRGTVRRRRGRRDAYPTRRCDDGARRTPTEVAVRRGPCRSSSCRRKRRCQPS